MTRHRDRRPDPVHLYDTSGTVLCKGFDLADACRPLEQRPLRLTMDRCEVTCGYCREVIARLDREQAVA